MSDTPSFIDDYLLYLLAQASAAVSSEFHARLAELGMPVPKWRVLASLHQTSGRTIGALARTCLMKQPTVSKIVDKLVADGLIERYEGQGQNGSIDRRQVHVRLTRAGKESVSSLIEEARLHENRILASYSDEERHLVKTALKTLVERSS